MAGLYIHIPFCKTRCLYCDFFSTTHLERQSAYIDALCHEIRMRQHEANEPIRTVYIGGGTPSTLPLELGTALNQAIDRTNIGEYTIEINPGDVDEHYLSALRAMGVNRISFGVQSLNDRLLRLIGRRHTAQQAIDAVRRAQEAGFDNISIDLMYALPTQTMEQWKADIETALRLDVQHISSYGLMYEQGTAMTRMLQCAEIEAIDEETENEMYDYLCERLQQAGYEHYEVSNFALPGMKSKHNSSYWNGTPYIGVGAGAHSFIGNVRSWNICDIEAYIQGMKDGSIRRESETLTDNDRYNERIMLGLRTNQGVARKDIQTDVKALMDSGLVRETENEYIVATQQGIHVLNRIIEDLMI